MKISRWLICRLPWSACTRPSFASFADSSVTTAIWRSGSKLSMAIRARYDWFYLLLKFRNITKKTHTLKIYHFFIILSTLSNGCFPGKQGHHRLDCQVQHQIDRISRCKSFSYSNTFGSKCISRSNYLLRRMKNYSILFKVLAFCHSYFSWSTARSLLWHELSTACTWWATSRSCPDTRPSGRPSTSLHSMPTSLEMLCLSSVVLTYMKW